MKEIFNGFSPVVFEDSEILILGSFPSVKSRQNNFYYGNPQNKFWKLIASCFEEDLPKTIEEKVNLCQKHKIALWDIYSESDISGSSDLKLAASNFKLSEIDILLKKYKNIKKILCNGALAYNTLIKNFNLSVPIIKLTSTSPACVNFDRESWINQLKKT